jgi:hypothetical protein
MTEGWLPVNCRDDQWGGPSLSKNKETDDGCDRYWHTDKPDQQFADHEMLIVGCVLVRVQNRRHGWGMRNGHDLPPALKIEHPDQDDDDQGNAHEPENTCAQHIVFLH